MVYGMCEVKIIYNGDIIGIGQSISLIYESRIDPLIYSGDGKLVDLGYEMWEGSVSVNRFMIALKKVDNDTHFLYHMKVDLKLSGKFNGRLIRDCQLMSTGLEVISGFTLIGENACWCYQYKKFNPKD